MSLVGISMAYIAMVDPDKRTLIADAQKGLSTSGILPLDKTYLGVQKADIKGFTGKFTTICGNNQIMDSYQEPASTSVSLTVNNLSRDVLNKILGLASNTGNGAKMAKIEMVKKPLIGLILAAPVYNGDETIYYAFPVGRISEQNQNLSTNTDTKKNVEYDTLDFTALSYDRFGGNKYGIYSSKFDGFSIDAMFKDIYPEYSGNLATTATPSTSTSMPSIEK